MNEHSILLVDGDPKNLKVLDDAFTEASFQTAQARSDKEALKILDQGSFNIVLSDLSAPSIDGYYLLKEIQRDPGKSGKNVVFTSIKSDVWNRVKSLKLGAKDFIVKPIHASEIVARINMLLRRVRRNEGLRASESNQLSGRLEDLAVLDLIELFGAEKKTGILTVHNENGHSGQIVFQRGQVVSAGTDSLRAEEAVYKMMHWNRGRFSMMFADVPYEDEFTVSNMGLLLQGAKRMDLRNELLKQLPSLDAVVITTSNFKKITSQKEMNNDLKEFLTLFDGERTLGRIIDDSHENEIVTLKRIVKLYKLGFLYVLRNFSKGESLQFRSEEEMSPGYIPFEVTDDYDEESEEPITDAIPGVVEENASGDFDLDEERAVDPRQDVTANLRANLDDEDEAMLKKNQSLQNIIVISTQTAELERFIHYVAEDAEPDKKGEGSAKLFYSVLKLRGGKNINVFGITPDEAITDSMLYFSDHTIGCILLIPLAHANWSYLRYLYKILHKKLSMPLLVVCHQGVGQSDYSSAHITELLDMDAESPLQFIDEFEESKVRRTLFALLREQPESSDFKHESIAAK